MTAVTRENNLVVATVVALGVVVGVATVVVEVATVGGDGVAVGEEEVVVDMGAEVAVGVEVIGGKVDARTLFVERVFSPLEL